MKITGLNALLFAPLDGCDPYELKQLALHKMPPEDGLEKQCWDVIKNYADTLIWFDHLTKRANDADTARPG